MAWRWLVWFAATRVFRETVLRHELPKSDLTGRCLCDDIILWSQVLPDEKGRGGGVSRELPVKSVFTPCTFPAYCQQKQNHISKNLFPSLYMTETVGMKHLSSGVCARHQALIVSLQGLDFCRILQKCLVFDYQKRCWKCKWVKAWTR